MIFFCSGSCSDKQLDIFGLRSEDAQLTVSHTGSTGWKFRVIRIFTQQNYLEWLGREIGEFHNNQRTLFFQGIYALNQI